MTRYLGHPSLRLIAWICAVVALQRAHGGLLAGLLAVTAIVVGAPARSRWYGLLRRSRILLLVLGATYALLTPGEALVVGYWGTVEGVVAAVDQLLRLVLMLGAVAWLLASTPTSELLAGIHGLTRPLAFRARSDGRVLAERFAVRLSLVLRYAESPIARDWRTLLGDVDAEAGGPVQFEAVPMRAMHWLLAGCLVVATGWVLLR